MVIRARFFEKENWGNGVFLNRAKEVIESFDKNNPADDINGIIEYYNIIRMYDADYFPMYFTAEAVQQYVPVVKHFRGVVGRYLSQLSAEELTKKYDITETSLRGSFFDAINHYKTYEKWSDEQFDSFLEEHPTTLSLVVCSKDIVNHFQEVIRLKMLEDPAHAELVISHYFVQGSEASSQTNMPLSLRKSDIECIVDKYIDYDKANPNYLYVISVNKTGDFPTNDKLRLKAKKKYDAYWQAHREAGNQGIVVGAEVMITNQSDAVKISDGESIHVKKYSYSREWIEENLDYPTLFNNFIYLLGFVDDSFRCVFVSNPADLGIIERLFGVHGTNEYRTGIVYLATRARTCAQLQSYLSELSSHGISAEGMFKWFFEEYIRQEFGIKNYCYVTPSPQASTLEKILLLASQIDAVIKQFKMITEDGEINRELFEFSSSMSRIVDTPSMLDNKYVYSSSAEIDRAMGLLFSDQCTLSYTEKTNDKYRSFAELITYDRISLSDYHDFEQSDLNWLINQKIIETDKEGFLRITDISLLHILSDLNFDGSIAYMHCSKKEKDIIDDMLAKGALTAEKKLFTRQEQDYLDYMLNERQFINGPEIRNKYVHGCFPLDKEQQNEDYLELLKIMVIIVIKINEEFCSEVGTDQ